MPWAELWLIYTLAEYFKFKILYTPIFPYYVDVESQKQGSYLNFLKEIETDFSSNHHPYLKEGAFNQIFIFDQEGARKAKQYARHDKKRRPMLMSREYYELYVGSASLDIYKPQLGGWMLQVDTTHGYHEKTIHLATRYPRTIDTKSNIIKLLPNNVWIAMGISILSIAIAILFTILMYKKVSPILLRDNFTVTQILFRLFAGFTEPDNEHWFTNFSTGTYTNEAFRCQNLNHFMPKFTHYRAGSFFARHSRHRDSMSQHKDLIVPSSELYIRVCALWAILINSYCTYNVL